MPSFDPAAGFRCNLQNQNALRCTLLSKFHAVNAKRGHPSDVFPYARMKKFLIMKAELQMQRLLGSKCLLIKTWTWPTLIQFSVCCLARSKPRRGIHHYWHVDPITGETLKVSYRPMIKSSVWAPLQPHHSGCPRKATGHCKRKRRKKPSQVSSRQRRPNSVTPTETPGWVALKCWKLNKSLTVDLVRILENQLLAFFF